VKWYTGKEYQITFCESKKMAVEYSMNIYRGCSHGCIYCSSRGEYYKILDFNYERVEKDVLRAIKNDLTYRKPCVVATGGLSDPYNPLERTYKLTRKALELINELHLGICIMTKSNMIIRDMDILRDIKSHSPVNVCFSITCAEDEMCRMIEPFAPTSSQRFEAIKELMCCGITTGVVLNPILPYITDTEANIRGIVKKAKEAGAHYIYATMGVVLEDSQREHFFKQAETFFPGTQGEYMKRFGNSQYCCSPHEGKLWAIFAEECEQQGIAYDMHVSNTVTRDARVFASALMNLCMKQ
jgi:DNA repair photolyase